MAQPQPPQTRYDAAAMLASGLCLVHCLFLPALLFMMPALAVWITVPESFHFWMLIIAVPISLIALYIGLRRHKNWMPIMIAMPALVSLTAGALLFHGMVLETWLTAAGAFGLTFAHLLNRRHSDIRSSV
ncbi:MAG: MerC domain-containing protein [Sphingorhabdus sp.]|uniref:MerC domain-containing protein n=1 Tax=Sphingorhabdus sp. TaxID=1902408 RepID=UPI00345AF9AF|nr:MerC domain-containing protein [Sphingorhabdus sp.]